MKSSIEPSMSPRYCPRWPLMYLAWTPRTQMCKLSQVQWWHFGPPGQPRWAFKYFFFFAGIWISLQPRCDWRERVPNRLQFTRSPFGAVSIISGATAKEIRVSSVNRARVLSSNSIINAVNSLSSMKRTCWIVLPRSLGYSIPLYLDIGSSRFLCCTPQFVRAATQGFYRSANANNHIEDLRPGRVLVYFFDPSPDPPRGPTGGQKLLAVKQNVLPPSQAACFLRSHRRHQACERSACSTASW